MTLSIKGIKIVTMDQHFLYLPLYYAESKKWFGHIPEEYRLGIKIDPYHSDKGAVDALLDHSSENKDVLFAICDPAAAMVTGAATEDQKLVFLASLITNASFWAIDTKAITVESLADLYQYDKIISFDQGSTSFAIARQACRAACQGRMEDDAINQIIIKKIMKVTANQELAELDKHVKLANQRTSEGNWVALSPDLLGFEKLRCKDNRYSIDLALGETTDYSNVLVTALVSRLDVVHEHDALVRGLLRALQVALTHTMSSNDAIINFASEYFGETDREIVKKALDQAIKNYNVYPRSVVIYPPEWNRAVKIAKDAWEGYDGEGSYEVMVAPYVHFARDAVNYVFQDMLDKMRTPATASASSWLLILVVLVSMVLGGCLVYIGGWGACAVGLGACIWGIVPLDRLRIGLCSRTGGLHLVYTLGIAACVLLLLPTYFYISDVGVRCGVAGILV